MGRRDAEALLKKVQKTEGWTVEKTNGQHYKVCSPTGEMVFLPSTPGDHRALKNMKAALKRAGWRPPQ